MDISDVVSVCIVLVAVSAAAITDIWKFKIYNVLTFPLILSGFAFHAVTGGAAGMSFSASGILFGLFALLIPFVLGAIGAGDAKLIAGIGAWLGAWLTAVIFLGCSDWWGDLLAGYSAPPRKCTAMPAGPSARRLSSGYVGSASWRRKESDRSFRNQTHVDGSYRLAQWSPSQSYWSWYGPT